ncbi:MAG: glycosyltransferase family 39 protein [bacterium]
MANSRKTLQDMVHSLDQGGLVPVIRVAMFAALILTLTLLYLFVQFRGLSSAAAMDQAQIARQLAMGNGFSTQYIRPLAIKQLEDTGRQVPTGDFPDFFQSPLHPLLNSLPLKLVESSWKLSPTDLVYVGDRMIAAIAVLMFFLSIWVWYLVGCRLFDRLIATIGCAIVILCDLMWQFSLSGLPQMLLLLLLATASWLTLKAMENKDKLTTSLGFLFAAGLVFGLMVLTHGATFWIFMGWLVFALFHFKPRGIAGLVALGALLIVTLPWLARNYSVCGNPLGLAGYEMVAPVNTAETGYLRSISDTPPLSGIHPFNRLKNAVFTQSDRLFAYLGVNIVAAAFFIALVHRFKSPATAAFRVCVVLMWLGAFVGMGLCGVEEVVSSNQFHVLFIPLFVFFGLAFLLVLWNRLEIEIPLLRNVFIGVLVFLCALPMLATLFAGKDMAVQWPPYVPPFIAVLGDWYGKDEVIATDMPWATAWYAQRKSLLLPKTIKDFNRISDFRVLGTQISGLYLTPVTGNRPLFGDIYKGPYTDWVFMITRPPNVQGFSLPVFTPLPIDGECILFSDRDRWSRRE